MNWIKLPPKGPHHQPDSLHKCDVCKMAITRMFKKVVLKRKARQIASEPLPSMIGFSSLASDVWVLGLVVVAVLEKP